MNDWREYTRLAIVAWGFGFTLHYGNGGWLMFAILTLFIFELIAGDFQDD